MSDAMKCLARIGEKTALMISAGLFALLSLCGLFLTAHLGKQRWHHEVLLFTRDSPLANLAWMALMLMGILLFYRGLLRFANIKLGSGLLGVWCVLTFTLVIGANVVQKYDFAYVIEAAELFAAGNYKVLNIDYFNVYSYQLGICLPMELVKRLLPGISLTLFMQGLNVLLSAGIALVMTVFSCLLFGDREAKAVILLYVLFLPMALQCIFVYSTLPMMLMTSLAMLCFTLYVKKRKARFALGYVLCIAVAYMLKPNAAIPLTALAICAILDVMDSRDWKLLVYAAVSVLLSVALQRIAIMQYELRGGTALGEDVSMLARLVMGLQRGGPQAGWYNWYVEQFFSFDVTAQQEYEIASADLAARLAEMKADPKMTFEFFKDKMLSQWLEPSYGALWYGDLCEHSGALGGISKEIFRGDGMIRAALEGYMMIFQKVLYVLIALGLTDLLRDKKAVGTMLVLPVNALGGWLYHMIFEAKAQYMYVYVMMMMPLAAHGLSRISLLLRRKESLCRCKM